MTLVTCTRKVGFSYWPLLWMSPCSESGGVCFVGGYSSATSVGGSLDLHRIRGQRRLYEGTSTANLQDASLRGSQSLHSSQGEIPNAKQPALTKPQSPEPTRFLTSI